MNRASGVGRCALLLVGAVALVFSTSGRAGVGDPALVTYQANGVGVDVEGSLRKLQVPEQINYDPSAQQSEALALNLGQGGATSAKVTVSNLLLNESTGECGKWEAFDALGAAVGSRSFLGTNALTFEIEIIADGGKSFQYLVFTALPYACAETQTIPPNNDSSDYFVRQVSFGGKVFPQDGGQDDDGWAGLAPTGFDFGTPYLVNDRFVGAEVVEIDTEQCTGSAEGANNTDGCTIELSDEFTTNIRNSPDVRGTIKINPVLTLVDPRGSCGGDDPYADGPWDLEYNLGGGLSGPVIPEYLCGIPASEDGPGHSAGDPIIRVLDIDSDLTAISSVLEHTVTTTINPHFECKKGQAILDGPDPGLDRSELPVIGWLPKTAGNVLQDEIPVFDSRGDLVTELQDVTYGCGSARGGTSRYSYFVYNLRHHKDADYDAITLRAIEQLGATIDQAAACLPGKGDFAGLAGQVRSATREFNKGSLAKSKTRLQGLLNKVESKQLETRLARCLYNLESRHVLVGDPNDRSVPTVVPRNFRGDLIVQLRHILYMYGRMLGVKPSISDDLLGVEPSISDDI